MEFWILGRVAVGSRDKLIHFRSGMQCSLLAALLAAEGQAASAGMLIAELWGNDLPDQVENALQAHVSRLRRKLQSIEPERAASRLQAQTCGYRLALDGASVDAMTFTSALNDARAVASSCPAETAYRLRSALALWRGPVFGGVAVGLTAQAAAARIEASRIAALELLFDIELQLGGHTQIVPELTALVRAEAPNERLCEQLMVALYRCGRQTDALSVYQWMRNRMAEELGVDPSPMLRNHERAILSHDPELRPNEDHLILRDRVG
ncbi:MULTISPECIES: AfsR/SARP family transcriptional regulator [unclassified Solwaraspora]|uniref:AfsR/SARP family transcriptional regulator n=1 Tax=unclassified Solwaraspora TaxID=2627926 RepID=UPI00248B3736|nr:MULTISPECIES: AfsR/SARP family transcriptional regulator [unclassified Solwaraspora]WBB95659.1 AfsR/SARP family transcriptional regulator [Solwaraspora sp. WMMA2059]WBC20439.1 AfsR/SARP family transcriptional regulator [Solwaraspora sp. WMMA2080]WJK37410.1 AfsR/SARP family transcriptional regulator [Solwaraspora sp. WMMA2065]